MRITYSFLAAHGLALAMAQTNVTCQSGVKIFVARASGEPPGFGLLTPVKDMILSNISSSDAVAVPYPATIGGPIPYPTSEQEGAGNLTQLVTQYGDACPSSKMVLMGYSQGAQVVGDTLIGNDYMKTPIFGNRTGIDQKYIDNIVAVVMMGDPANVAGQPFLHGNSTRNGYFPRANTADWASKGIVPKMISYCDANDTFCDSGSSLAVHVGYIVEYGTAAAAFVVEKATASNSSSPSASSSSKPTTSAAAPTTSTPTSSTSVPATSTGPVAAATTSPGSGAAILEPGRWIYALTGLLQCSLVFAALL